MPVHEIGTEIIHGGVHAGTCTIPTWNRNCPHLDTITHAYTSAQSHKATSVHNHTSPNLYTIIYAHTCIQPHTPTYIYTSMLISIHTCSHLHTHEHNTRTTEHMHSSEGLPRVHLTETSCSRLASLGQNTLTNPFWLLRRQQKFRLKIDIVCKCRPLSQRSLKRFLYTRQKPALNTPLPSPTPTPCPLACSLKGKQAGSYGLL